MKKIILIIIYFALFLKCSTCLSKSNELTNIEEKIYSNEIEDNSGEHLERKNYPEGFEDVMDKDVLNSYIELYINNKKIGILNIEYNKEYIIIKEQKTFNKYLENFKYKEEIIKKLINNKISNKIITENYSFIFIKSKEKLFIESNEFSLLTYDKKSFNSPDFSIIQNLYSSYFKDEKLNYNLGGDLSLSKDNKMLITNWNKSQDDFFINNLYYNNRTKDNEYSMGYFNYKTNNNLIAGKEFLGLEYSKKGREINKKKNDKIQLYIQRRSKVYIYREEELLLIKEFEEGIQEIKTNIFPEGSYYVDIVVDDGFIIKKEKEFIQNVNLENLYSIYVGKIKNKNKNILFDTENDLFFKFDKTFYYKKIYISPELFYLNNDYIMNTNFNYNSNKNYFIDFNVLIGNKKSYGLGMNFNYNMDNLFLNYNGNVLKTEENDLIENKMTSHNINYGLNLKEKGFFNSYFSYYKNDLYKTKEIGLSYQNSYNLKLNNSISYSFNISRRNKENIYSFRLSYKFNKNNQRFRTSILNNNNEISNTNSYFNKITNENSIQSIQYLNNIYNDDIYHSLSYNWVNDNYGNYEHVFNYKDNLSYFGNFNTNIAYTKNNYGYGGKYINNTGVIIEIESEKDLYYDVKINKELFKIKSNKKVFIPLNSEKEYEIYLSTNKKDIDMYISDKKETIYLNKGEVEYIKRKSKKSYILITKLRKDNKLIKNSTLYFNENLYFIDEKGLLNLNVFEGENIFKINNTECKIFIEKSKEKVIFKNEMKCKNGE